MNRQEWLLTTAMEECDEVSQRVSKALRFGMDEVQPDAAANPDGLTNRQRVMKEFYDLRATLGMAGFDAWDGSDCARAAERAKVQKLDKYMAYAREQGTLAMSGPELIAALEQKADAIPIGSEDASKGASAYNWWRSVIGEAKRLVSRV